MHIPPRMIRAMTMVLAILMIFSMLTLTSCQPDPGAEVPTVPDETMPTGSSPAETVGETGAVPEDTLPAETQPADAEEGKQTLPAQDMPAEPADDTPEPVFSVTGGLCTGRQTLTLSLPENAPEGAVIRYTTDGSVPTAKSAAFSSAIRLAAQVGEGKVVRAACFDARGNRLGDVVTHSYVYVSDTARTVYTVMITVAEKDLNAMVAAPAEKIERPAHVEIVTPAGELVISQDAGLRLFGGSSRGLPQKSFKLIARKDGYFGETAAYVGKGSFAYPLFPDRLVEAGEDAGQVLARFDSFILRNGGNDSLQHTACDPTNATLLRDGVVNNFAHTFAPHVNCSLSQFAAVYVNGAFYGLLDMRENLNEDYVKRVYGVNDDDVVVIKSELDTTRHCDLDTNGGACRFHNVWFYLETDADQRSQAALAEWQALCKKLSDGMNKTGDDYAALFAEVSAQVDLQSFMEYMALNLYVCNTDWPHNNVKLWKYVGEAVDGVSVTDGKWRFMTRDMDMAMGRYMSPDVLPELDNRATTDTFWRVLGNYVSGYSALYENRDETRLYPDSLGLQAMLAFCLKDEGFRKDFAAYARTLATAEASAALQAAYEVSYAQIRPLMQSHIDRWSTPEDYGDWTEACKRITDFISARPARFLTHLDIALEMYK